MQSTISQSTSILRKLFCFQNFVFMYFQNLHGKSAVDVVFM